MGILVDVIVFLEVGVAQIAKEVPILIALIKVLAPMNNGWMNGGFLVDKGLLVHSVKDGISRNSIFCNFQSI
jgi:hypothetical protein